MSSCIFCDMIEGRAQVQRVSETEDFIVIKDLYPRAPLHWLIIPKIHIARLHDAKDALLLGRMLQYVASLDEDIQNKGYRTVINTGHDGGQTIDHLHIHLLAGRPLKWPPG